MALTVRRGLIHLIEILKFNIRVIMAVIFNRMQSKINLVRKKSSW